jgi:hypothetical protein
MSRTLFSCLQEKVQENRGVSGLAFLPCGHGSVLAGVRSIRFDQGPRLEFLLHLLQSFVCAELLQACRHRRASVGDGRPSACHGCAVACIGQPPPPSAPGPVMGLRPRQLSRGWGPTRLQDQEALWKDAANQWHVSRHAGSVMRHERFTELIGDIGFDCAIA